MQLLAVHPPEASDLQCAKLICRLLRVSLWGKALLDMDEVEGQGAFATVDDIMLLCS